MPRLSILIPALETPEALETTLLSVLENRPHHCQVLVALGIDYANPYQLDDEVEFVKGAGRDWARCVNAALSHCRAEVVHIVTAGMTVEQSWSDAALEHFKSPRVGLVTPLVVSAREPSRVLIAGVRYGFGGSKATVQRPTKGARPLAPSSMAGFYRLETLAQLGGFSSAVGEELTDLDLALRAFAAGWEAVAEPAARVFGEPLAAPKRSFASGRAAERFFWRHLSSRNNGPAVAGHAMRVLGELAIGVVRPRMLLHCLGRLAAVWPARDDGAELPLQHQHPAPSLLGLPIGATTESGTRRRVA